MLCLDLKKITIDWMHNNHIGYQLDLNSYVMRQINKEQCCTTKGHWCSSIRKVDHLLKYCKMKQYITLEIHVVHKNSCVVYAMMNMMKKCSLSTSDYKSSLHGCYKEWIRYNIHHLPLQALIIGDEVILRSQWCRHMPCIGGLTT